MLLGKENESNLKFKNMESSLIYSGLFLVIGLFAVVVGITNWDFFLNPKIGTTVVKIFGRFGTRVVYMLLGLLIFSAGVVSITVDGL